MEVYDYHKAVSDSLQDYLNDWFERHDISEYSSFDDLLDDVIEHAQDSDSVTGKGSGSFTSNSWKAEEYLCHNTDLLREACGNFGYNVGETFERGPKTCDVIIRSYVLGEVVYKVLEDYLMENFPEAQLD